MSHLLLECFLAATKDVVVYDTSKTLLEKLRDPNDVAAWHRFVELYLPLLFWWARQLPLQGFDPEDFVQDILLKLVQKLPEFQYDPDGGGFRNWLRTLCHNHWRDHCRKLANRVSPANEAGLADLEVTDLDLERFWNEDYYGLLVAKTFRIMESDFDPTTRTAFTEVVLKERSVKEVAQELGLTPNAVSLRKIRVLQRLRQEFAEFA